MAKKNSNGKSKLERILRGECGSFVDFKRDAGFLSRYFKGMNHNVAYILSSGRDFVHTSTIEFDYKKYDHMGYRVDDMVFFHSNKLDVKFKLECPEFFNLADFYRQLGAEDFLENIDVIQEYYYDYLNDRISNAKDSQEITIDIDELVTNIFNSATSNNQLSISQSDVRDICLFLSHDSLSYYLNVILSSRFTLCGMAENLFVQRSIISGLMDIGQDNKQSVDFPYVSKLFMDKKYDNHDCQFIFRSINNRRDISDIFNGLAVLPTNHSTDMHYALLFDLHLKQCVQLYFDTLYLNSGFGQSIDWKNLNIKNLKVKTSAVLTQTGFSSIKFKISGVNSEVSNHLRGFLSGLLDDSQCFNMICSALYLCNGLSDCYSIPEDDEVLDCLVYLERISSLLSDADSDADLVISDDLIRKFDLISDCVNEWMQQPIYSLSEMKVNVCIQYFAVKYYGRRIQNSNGELLLDFDEAPIHLRSDIDTSEDKVFDKIISFLELYNASITILDGIDIVYSDMLNYLLVTYYAGLLASIGENIELLTDVELDALLTTYIHGRQDKQIIGGFVFGLDIYNDYLVKLLDNGDDEFELVELTNRKNVNVVNNFQFKTDKHKSDWRMSENELKKILIDFSIDENGGKQ